MILFNPLHFSEHKATIESNQRSICVNFVSNGDEKKFNCMSASGANTFKRIIFIPDRS